MTQYDFRTCRWCRRVLPKEAFDWSPMSANLAAPKRRRVCRECAVDRNPGGLCQCGCGRTTPIANCTIQRLGNVAGMHLRFMPGHDHKKSDEERYWVNEETGCWEWLGGLNNHGYGRAYQDGKTVSAHRMFYERKYGSIPHDREIDHLCRNHACVNPDHMEPVTRTENCRRKARTVLTPDLVREIRSLRGVESCVKLGRRYGVSKSNILAVWHHEIWKDVQ